MPSANHLAQAASLRSSDRQSSHVERVITVILFILGATTHRAQWLIPARHAVDRLLFSLLRRRILGSPIVSSLHVARVA